jgi:hypothetical protein
MNTMVIIATLVGVVEAYMLMFCGFRLVGFSPSHRRLLVAAVAVALFVRASRQVLYTVFNAPFGTHIVVALVSFFLVAYLWFKIPAVLAAIAVVIGDMLLSLGTMLVSLLLPDVVPSDPGTILMLIAVEQAPLILATLVISRTRLSIVPRRVTQNLKG